MAVRSMPLQNTIAHKLSSVSLSRWVPWAIIGFGIFVRLLQYWQNASLWVDDAALALNIINRSYAELLQPLDFATGAPVGYLMLQKFIVLNLGESELDLRLVSLLAGISSLFLFYAVARQHLSDRAVPVALALFALSTPLVVYSNQVKQYSTDVLVALLILWVSTILIRWGFRAALLPLYAAMGAVVIWFSHPAVFVLAGTGAVFALDCLRKRDWLKFALLSAVYLVWLVSFVISFKVATVESLVNDEELVGSLARVEVFAPFPPLSLSDIAWYLTSAFAIFENPAGLTLMGLAALAFLVGIISLTKTNRHSFFLLVAPLGFTFLASSAHFYPFAERWLLFLAPAILLVVGEGAALVFDRLRRANLLMGVGFVALLLLHLLASELFHMVEPRGTQDIKPVMGYVSSRMEEGDALYVYHGARKQFWYYAERFGFDEGEYIIGDGGSGKWGRLDAYVSQIDALRGSGRVWIIISSVNEWQGINDEEFLVHHLDAIGERVDSFRSDSAVAYLYDLS